MLAVVLGVSSACAAAGGVYTYTSSNDPSSRPFGSSMLAGSVWTAGTAALAVFRDPLALEAAYSLASIAALWLVLYYVQFLATYTATDIADRHRRWVTYAGGVFTVGWLFDIVVPVFHSSPRLVTANGLRHPVVETQPLFLPFILFIYVVVLAGVWMLVRFYFRDNNLHRTETAVVLAITLIGLGSNAAVRLGVTPHPGVDITPLSYTLVLLLSGYVLFSQEYLDFSDVAPGVVVENLSEPVVVLNQNRQIIEANARARELFEPDESLVDTSADTHLPSHILTGDFANRPYNDGSREFIVGRTPLVDQYNTEKGEILVFRDVTEQARARRQIEDQQVELELYQEIVDRVLRHNISTAVNVINGQAEQICEAAPSDSQIETSAETIRNRGSRLEGVSENARELRRIIEQRDRTSTVDLTEVATRAAQTMADDDVEIRVDAPERCLACVTVGVTSAVENLIRNAIEHNDGTAVVSVTVESAPPTVRVSDNGPGIPEAEIRTIEATEETPLEHGSGVGLWLAERVATYSGGQIEVENTDGGASVRLVFEPPSDHDEPTAAAEAE